MNLVKYFEGYGVEEDSEKAPSWYTKAAARGHIVAQKNRIKFTVIMVWVSKKT